MHGTATHPTATRDSTGRPRNARRLTDAEGSPAPAVADRPVAGGRDAAGRIAAALELAQRDGHPLACLALRVDRLERAHSPEWLAREVVAFVRSRTRAADLLVVGPDLGLLGLFAGVPRAAVGRIAERLVADGRRFRTPSDVTITFSVGLAHSGHPDLVNLRTLLPVAEDGAAVAEASGGDRFVESELYALHESFAARAGAPAIPVMSAVADVAAPPADRRGPRALPEGQDVEQKAAELAGAIVERAVRELEHEHGRALLHRDAMYREQIDILERRIAKLSTSLGTTERELRLVRSREPLDTGIASIYRDVQGLSGDEPELKLKYELMRTIFEANAGLQRQLAARRVAQ